MSPSSVVRSVALALALTVSAPSIRRESRLQADLEWIESGNYSDRVLAARNLRAYRDRRVRVRLLRHALDPKESTGVVDECLGSLLAVGDEVSVSALRAAAPEGRSDLSDCAQLIAERIGREDQE